MSVFERQMSATAKIFAHPLDIWYAAAWDHEVTSKKPLARPVSKRALVLSRTVAGLAPVEPNYRRLRVAPRPGPGVIRGATHKTPHGTASVSWAVDGTTPTLDVTVPAGAVTEVALPDASAPVEVGSGRHSFTREITVPAPVEKPALFFNPDDHQ